MDSIKQQKIVYLSWIVPPAQGGSAYIVHQLAKHFDSENLTIAGGCKRPFKGKAKYDGIWYHYFFTELNWFGHGDRYFTLFRWLLFPFFVFNLSSLVRKERPDVIVLSFPDGYYLLAGYLLSKFFNLKLYSYFHNTYTENRRGISKWFAEKIQDLIFKRSNIIFLMSDGMRQHYIEGYVEFTHKFKILPHTFDKYPAIDSVQIKSKAELPFKLVMIGTFNASNMEATLRLLHCISKYPKLYQLDIYSASKKPLLKLKWNLDLDALGIRHLGFVKQEEVISILSQYDICLLTHGFSGGYTEIEYQTIFPTRMIPLLLSGVPILAHSPENSFLNSFIRKYDCAELVSEPSDEFLSSALSRICNDKNRRIQLIENANVASTYFYGPDVIKIFKNLLLQ